MAGNWRNRRWGHYLLIRRRRSKPDELAYYVVFYVVFSLRERASLARRSHRKKAAVERIAWTLPELRRRQLARTFGCVRYVYNHFLRERTDAW